MLLHAALKRCLLVPSHGKHLQQKMLLSIARYNALIRY